MVSPQALSLFEQIYAKVDKQVREIVKSMLPDVTIAAQDDGAVIANDHRIMNFQGPGVNVTDEPGRRRVNVFVPGAPVSTGTQTIQSSQSGIKCRSLWTGSSNTTPPAGWTTVGFDDSTWTTPVTVGSGGPGGAALWPTSTPASATEQALFRHVFTIATGTQVATASLTELQDDDLIGVWINGTLVGTDVGTSTNTFTVTPSILVIGSNVIAFQVRNTD